MLHCTRKILMLCYNASSNVTLIDPRVTNSLALDLYQLYIYAGVPAVAANFVCIGVFILKQELRSRYLLFATLAFGDLLTGLGMLLAGIYRTQLILNNDYNKRTSFECLRNPWPHFYIVGGQLSAFVMLLMGIERILAVYKPLLYKKCATHQLRLIVTGQCFLLALISLIIGYMCSYLNSDQCVSAMCSTSNTTGRSYSDYNYIVLIGFPIVALILNVSTYIGAKRASADANMQREWHKVLLTLAICTCSVILIAAPNILLWGYMRYWNPVFMPYLFIAFCCYSTINLFVYFVMKRDFRRQLLCMLSLGLLKFTDSSGQKSEMRLIQKKTNDAIKSAQEMTDIQQ